MSTRLLAETNGDISIIQVHVNTRSYKVVQQVMEKTTRKLFNKNQGKSWELFLNVEDATKWILAQQKPKVEIVKPGSKEWFKREKEVQESYAVPIVTCNNCGSPRHKSYTCVYCDKE